MKSGKKVRTLTTLPPHSIVAEGFGRIDYADIFVVTIGNPESVDRITTRIFGVANWIKFLMKLRNRIVRIFGLSGEDGKAMEADYYPVGSKAVFFEVTARNENEIVMAEEEKHLNFRTSVVVERKGTETARVYMTTLVHYNNVWGRFYFFFVRPFHRVIVREQLKKAGELIRM